MKFNNYKRVIKRILMNISNEQLQVTIPNGCGFEPDDLVKIVPFDKRKKVYPFRCKQQQ